MRFPSPYLHKHERDVEGRFSGHLLAREGQAENRSRAVTAVRPYPSLPNPC
jgi:hypothetical protein